MEEAYCPNCSAELGSPQGEVGIYCWKCGLAFGPTASTKPVIREKSSAGRFSTDKVIAALFAPGLVYWGMIVGYPRLPWRIPPTLDLVWLAPAFGLAVFGFACLSYAVEWVAQSERNAAWLLKAALCASAIIADVFLLLGAILILVG